MRPSQIIAIDRVNLEAAQTVRERLVWFYGELVGLTFIEDTLDSTRLLFRSAQLELCIKLVNQPVVERNRRRAVLSVRSLEQAAAQLDEDGIRYLQVSGWSWTDRRLSLLDPGGNRVELKQEWRRGVFPAPGQGALGADGRSPDGRTAKKNKKDT